MATWHSTAFGFRILVCCLWRQGRRIVTRSKKLDRDMWKFSTDSVSAISLFKNFSHHVFARLRLSFIQHDRPDRLRFLFSNNLFLFSRDANDANIWRLWEICTLPCKSIWSIWRPWSWQKDPNIINKFRNFSILSTCRSKIHDCYTWFKIKTSDMTLIFGTRIKFSFRIFSFENHTWNKNSRSLFSLTSFV